MATLTAEPIRSREVLPAAANSVERYISLDAYRGLIMILLVSHGFGLTKLSAIPAFSALAAHPDPRGAKRWGWTASFTLVSAGWVLLIMSALVWIIDVKGYRKWAFPAVAVGMNCAFIYSIHIILSGWIDNAVGVFTGKFQLIGTLAPVAQACTVLVVMCSLCYWLYSRRIFKL